MFDKLKGIKLSTSFLTTGDLEFFKNDSTLLSLIFGPNGSGKTTISRSLYQLSIGSGEYIIDSFARDNSVLSFDDEMLKRIFVYNEDFIEREILFSSTDSVKSIVMFGMNKANDERVEEISKSIANNTAEISKLNFSKYEDPKSLYSLSYKREQIKKLLQSDWAPEEQKIRDIKTKPTVDNSDVDKFIMTKPLGRFDQKDYESKRDALLRTSQISQKVEDPLINDFHFKTDISSLANLLAKSFDRPIGSQMIQRISNTISRSSLSRLEEIKQSFTDGYCPYCFRDIDKAEIKQILNEINSIQNREVEQFRTDLNNRRFFEISINLNAFKIIDSKLVDEIELLISAINSWIKSVNTIINKKVENPFDPILVPVIPEAQIDSLIQKVSSLDQQRSQYNSIIENRLSLKRNVQDLNFQRVLFKHKNVYEDYHSLVDEIDRAKQKKSAYEAQNAGFRNEILSLKSSSQSTQLAMQRINEYLALIFLDPKRLYLEPNDSNYTVKSRGRNVKPRNLSNGERNAISLCYFFTLMNANKNETSQFSEPALIVLDDPLSSFDQNNKLGIYSFIRRMLSQILHNDSSRVIILTHQIDSFFELIQVAKDLNITEKENKMSLNILRDGNLETFSKRHFNLYREALKDIYSALHPDRRVEQKDLEDLGNKLRKVLEAFSTFSYGCSIDKLSTDPSLIQDLDCSQHLKDYFVDSMYRISLNETSHLENRAYSLLDMLTINYFEPQGLIRSVKDSLALIYILNKPHLQKMIGDDLSIITSHIDSIKSATGS